MPPASAVRRGWTFNPRAASSIAGIAYLITLPFDGLSAGGGRSLPFWFSIPFIATVLVDGLRALRTDDQWTHRPGNPSGTMTSLFAFGVFAAVSYFWSSNGSEAATELAGMALTIASCICLVRILAFRWEWLAYYVVSATVLAILVIHSPAVGYDSRRATAGNANDVAAILAVAFALAISFFLFSEHRRLRGTGGICALILAVGVVTTGSRSMLIGIGAAALIGVVILIRRRRPGEIFRALFAASVVVAGWQILPQQYVPARLSDIGAAISGGTLGNRTTYWDAVVARGPSLLGTGLGSSESYLESIFGQAHLTHNTFLDVYLELGVIGIVLFAFILWAAVRGLWRSKQRPGLLLVLGPFIAMTMSLSLLDRRSLWFCLCLGWAGSLMATRPVSNSTEADSPAADLIRPVSQPKIAAA